jgi:hypothetical protein
MRVGDVYYQVFELSIVSVYPGTAWKLVGQFTSISEMETALSDTSLYPTSGEYKVVRCEVVR